MNFYDILGVNKNATQDEIKKQYKKKALIIHPDKKNGNEEKFKELSEAYSVLSDEKKKQNYDIFGKDYDKISQNDDVFNLFSKMQHTQTHNVFNFNKPKDIEVNIDLTLEEIYNGVIKTISFSKNEKCNNCVNNSIIRCGECNGMGKVIQIKQMGPFIHHTENICNKCNGKGKYKANNTNCIICRGSSVINMRKNVQIKVPNGITPAHKIIINNEGHQNIDNELNGNLIIIFKELPHENFIRDKHNLLLKKDITIYDVLFKNKIEINHLDNKVFYIEGNDQEIICIPNEGMYIYNENNYNENNTKRGCLYIIFNIIYPNKKIPRNINISIDNNIIQKINKKDNNTATTSDLQVSVNNTELFSLLFEQKNNENKFVKQKIIETKEVSCNIKNKIKLLLINKSDNFNIYNDNNDEPCTTQ
jgi:DnaJ family protein A protein 2